MYGCDIDDNNYQNPHTLPVIQSYRLGGGDSELNYYLHTYWKFSNS